MYVVKVIPIKRGVAKEYLSFFSKNKLEEGSVIDAPIRNKVTPCLVVEAVSVQEEKLKLRGSSYALKKIAPRSPRKIFTSQTVQALKKVAQYHALPLGTVLAHFVPSAILSSSNVLLPIKETAREEETAVDRLVLQAEHEERMRMYRNLTREAFARGDSLMVVAPTIAEAENVYEKLHRGIEGQVLLVTSASTKKATIEAWNRANKDTRPLLIVCTYSFIAMPRKNLDAIVIEREGARSYVGRERPHIDARIAAEYIATAHGARIIYADFPLRIETHARLLSGELEELARLQTSAHTSAPVRIIDARNKKGEEQQGKKKKFSIFTDIVRNSVERELARGGRVFLYASRRGLAPMTACNDCDTPITDSTTGVPMTLHKTETGNMFLSYRSGALMPSNISCKHCGSWNLVSLGIGIERVYEEAEHLFKDTTLFLLTADSAPTHQKAKKIQKYFFTTPRAILIGTDRALPYLSEPVELSVIVSIDSMLSLSAWRAHEYALNTLFYIRDHTQDTVLVQTRQSDNEVIRAFASGNPTEFIRQELKERKTFAYPPFSTFIGLTWSGTEKTVHTITEEIKKSLIGLDIVGPLPPRQIAKNRFLARAVIRLEQGMWPEPRLLNTLKNLPLEVAIAVDPDEIV